MTTACSFSYVRTPRRALPWVVVALAACATLQYTPQEPLVAAAAYTLTDSTAVAVELSLVPALAQVGGAATIVDERLPRHLIIARPEADRYVVAASHCTHRDRALCYDHEKRRFRCSSLGHSEFELDGAVAGGLAEAPLMVYRSTVADGKLLVDLTCCCAPGVPCPCPDGAAPAAAQNP